MKSWFGCVQLSIFQVGIGLEDEHHVFRQGYETGDDEKVALKIDQLDLRSKTNKTDYELAIATSTSEAIV